VNKTWHVGPPGQILQSLESREQGLSAAEVAVRQRLHGPNALPRAELTGPLILFLRQFKNPLVYLLVVATGVSLLVGELLDALFIAVVEPKTSVPLCLSKATKL